LNDVIAFFGVDIGFGGLGLNGLLPIVKSKKWSCLDDVSPLGQKIVAGGILSFFAFTFYNGKTKMNIGVDEFVGKFTGGAFSATIVFCFLLAIQVRDKRKGQGQVGGTLPANKKLGVGYTVFFYLVDQSEFFLLLAGNIFEIHLIERLAN
jgi:hypothetical protein